MTVSVGEELNMMDATFGPVYPANDPNHDLCMKASAAFTRSLYAIAKAWVGNWEESFQITLDALKGSTDFAGSPWYLPAGCNGPGSPDRPTNDTMAVFVNGQNCATAPGTAMPVSINPINASSSSQYFVDNESGAGYPTSMDGMRRRSSARWRCRSANR